MQDIKNSIFRIENPKGYGSGFMYYPEQDRSYIYLITSRHNLVNDDLLWDLSELNFFFSTVEPGVALQLPESTIIYYGDNNEFEDIAVILIPKDAFREANFRFHRQRLCHLTDLETVATVSGFSKQTSGQYLRTLYKLTFLSDSDYSDEIQFEVQDPVSNQYNADNLVEGYSGSPIVIESGNDRFVCGLFRAYEKNSKRILGINFRMLNVLLTKHGHQEIPLPFIETDVNILGDIERLQSNTDRILKRIRGKIGNIELPRCVQVDNLRQYIINNRVVIVAGKAGSGKSALTKEVLHALSEEHQIIALQGEQLDKTDIVSVFSAEPFLFKNGLQSLLNSQALLPNKILLIDSIEKIMETNNSSTILDFLAIINADPTVKLVVTCRTYALENLKFRFLYEFPSYFSFEVPPLSHEELLDISSAYPHIQLLLKKESLQSVLEIPFNMDKATLLSDIQVPGLNTEFDFREIMWKFIIEGENKETSASVRKMRGELLSKIAVGRAEKMAIYTSVNDADPDVIHRLNGDNIIDVEPQRRISYAVSHDIYEDWALNRHIDVIYERHFKNGFAPVDFYAELGTAASIRRAFRLWMSEKVRRPDFDLEDLIRATLKAHIDNFWKDEILVAILQSDYSGHFLQNNTSLLYEDDFHIVKRCLLLLKVSCRKPDFDLLPYIKTELREHLYDDINLIPYGPGWDTLIHFIYNNLKDVQQILPVVIPVLFSWESSYGSSENFPKQARKVGFIILEYLKDDNFLEYDYQQNDYRDFDHIAKAIKLLFRLTPVVEKEVRDLIQHALDNKNVEEYRLRDLYDKILQFTLLDDTSAALCASFPEFILQIAEEEWFYKPNDAEKAEEEDEKIRAILSSSYKDEDIFGINDGVNMMYSNPGPKKTPIRHLLHVEPLKTLDFVTRLLNHATEFYLKTDFGLNIMLGMNDVREKIEIVLHDGKTVEQHCSLTLWTMYRGGYIAVPNLLKSVLMAVEDWLINLLDTLSKEVNSKQKAEHEKLLNDACEILVTKSNNVSPTAVVVSAALYNPNLLKKWMLPLLPVKVFYRWDIYRCAQEYKVNSPFTTRKERAYWEDLKRFNGLTHRKKTIQSIIFNYYPTEEKTIDTIIDNLYESAGEDREWRMLLNKMDVRKWEKIGESEEGIIMENKLPEDLQVLYSENEKKEITKSKYLQASTWGLRKFNNDPVNDSSYQQWKSHFSLSQSADAYQYKSHENQPVLLASIGIRDYGENLSSKEKEDCINLIAESVDYVLTGQGTLMDGSPDLRYSSFETDSAFGVLPIILNVEENKSPWKQRIFIGLIGLHIDYKLSRDKLIDSLNKYTWKDDPDFMLTCIRAILKYTEIAYLRGMQPQRMISGKEVNLDKKAVFRAVDFIKKLFTEKEKRVAQEKNVGKNPQDVYTEVFNEILEGLEVGNIQMSADHYNFDQRGVIFHAFEVLRIIPHATALEELREYIFSLLRFLYCTFEKETGWNNEKIHFELTQIFQRFLAAFMLHQPFDVASRVFDELLKPVFSIDEDAKYNRKKDGFIEQTLEWILWEIIPNHSLANNFWRLWDYFFKKITDYGTVYYGSKLLLNHTEFKLDSEWTPILGKKRFFGRVIPAIGDLDASARLIATIGYKELMPEAITWLSELLDNTQWSGQKETLFYIEKIAIRTFHHHEHRVNIRNSVTFRNNFINILDHLINNGLSSTAYVIREDLISSRR